MKYKILTGVAISVISLYLPLHALAQPLYAKYYGYGDHIYLKTTASTELLNLTIGPWEGEYTCLIEATGYVNVESSSAVLKVWLEVDGGWNGNDLATDEQITRRYIRSKGGALQSSFHTSLTKVISIPGSPSVNAKLLGSNFSGRGSLYVNYHSITASCFKSGEVSVVNPPVGISGHVYQTDGKTPFKGVVMRGFPSGVVTTDSNGFYGQTVPEGWSGVITPCTPSGGPCFAPPSWTYTNVTSNLTDQDYNQVLSFVACPPCP
jgi:hypothetical protein